jgi:hypothetical protein
MTRRVRAGVIGYVAFLVLVAVAALLLRAQAEDAEGAVEVRSVDVDDSLCSFLSDDAMADDSRPEAERVEILRSRMPELEAQEASAPDDIAADLRTVRLGAQRALEASQLEPMMTSEIALALGRLGNRCNNGRTR